MKDISTCRGLLEFLKEEGDLLNIKKEIDPIYEVSGVLKALENGPVLVFENVKGYPKQRIMCNIFSKIERVAKIFDVVNHRDLKFKGLNAFRNPILPKEVSFDAPCQEVVITENIDILKTMPIIKYTETDPGRIIGGGVVFISGQDIGNCISYKRMHICGKDWASLAFIPGSHFEHWVLERRKENQNLPITINFCTPPAVMAVAATGGVSWAIPSGSDELAFAGGIQGKPVEICRAKTVDAHAIANAEWVIEGYMDTSSRIGESEEVEKKGDSLAPFFPEWHGHEGRARTTYKFKATAITHRKDNPILEVWLAHSLQLPNVYRLTNDGLVYELLNRISPGLVTDVNSLDGMKQMGIVIQVKKRRRRDDGLIQQLILAAFSMINLLRIVIVVDDDVDIYNAEEILWALNTRLDPKEDMIIVPQTSEGVIDGPLRPVSKIGFDVTASKEHQTLYWRGEYPRVDLEKWLSKEEIAKVRAQQSEYGRLLAKKKV